MMKKILFVNLLCYAIAACLIAQPTLPDYGKHAFKQQALNDFVNIHSDLLMSVMPPCNPPFMVMGLYDPDVPLAPNPAIFADPMVKPEIMSDWFQGKDKEYGDIDNDGLIDIL